MVRINLLKQAVRKRRPERKPVPVKALVVTASVMGGLCLLVAAVWALKTFIKIELPREITVDEKLRPSTFSKANVVEDIVREDDDVGDMLKQSGMLELPYDELSPAEKVNYEIHFAQNVCGLLTRAVPRGIGFMTFSARDYRVIEGVTLTTSRDLITEMLNAMRRVDAEPLPRPQSVIRPRGNGFTFTFKAKTDFGLNLRAPFIDLELNHLSSRENLPYTVKKLGEVARERGVKIERGPTQTSVVPAGRLRRHNYQLSGVCTYKNFVNFVNGLQEQRVPCAFETFTLKALSGDQVSLEAHIVFTTIR